MQNNIQKINTDFFGYDKHFICTHIKILKSNSIQFFSNYETQKGANFRDSLRKIKKDFFSAKIYGK